MQGVDATPISPPIRSTSRLQMVSPSPVPPYLREVEESAWVKAWNSLLHCSSLRPMPVSMTSKRSQVPASLSCSRWMAMVISPCPVNLIALLSRLLSTWPRRMGSPSSPVGTSVSMSNSSSRPFSCALTMAWSARLPSTSSRKNSTFSKCILPASIFEKSRMSLMMPSRLCAAAWIFSR
ncbi:hypothetical protein D3C81_1333940 [compost metagenome]